MARSGKREMSQMALRAAEGLFAHTVDMALWFCVYVGEMSLPQSTSGQLWRAEREADRFLYQVNYDVIKHAMISAKRRGWLKTKRRGALPQVTQEGKRRLAAVIPQYDKKRVWDGRLHLVTYDIPESKKKYYWPSARPCARLKPPAVFFHCRCWPASCAAWLNG